jgi:hypothetical protein
MKKKFIMILILSVLGIAFVMSCATAPAPGVISEDASDYTGVKEMRMEPALLYDSSIKLALYKTTKMRPDDVIVAVVIKGKHDFSMGDSLYFTVDGKTVSFRSIDLMTNVHTTEGFYGSRIEVPEDKWTTRDYVVSKGFIKQIIDSEKVLVKVKTRLKEFEGIFSQDGPILARPAFKVFYKKMETLK